MNRTRPGLRYGSSTLPNLNFTVPRRADVAWLRANGYSKSRLPFEWEMLQPMLHDTPANEATRAAIGQPGAFHAGYESYITAILDEHAAAGMKCVLDLHNYCRYRDFVYQPDGSVIGLVVPSNPLIRPFTSDNRQVQERIFALAPGATLKQSNFNDFWTRAALKWRGHPGLGGYGLMNEPYHMPRVGQTVESDGYEQDLTIWPTYAQAAINAIRAVDPVTPIYLGGNDWSQAMSIASINPGWPLSGANIIYEIHFYLDAYSNGQSYDYDVELAKNFSAGFGWGVPINPDTGVNRLKLAVDWAQPRGLKLALCECGMPIDDLRWEEMWTRMLAYARQSGVDVFSWNGGSDWTHRNAGINSIPGWHQNKTLEHSASGPMKAAAGIAGATLYDDGPGWAAGTPITITVYARGNLPAPVSLTVSSNNGGTLSKTQLTIPAGANGQDSFTFTAAPERVTTLSYTSSGIAPPPPRRVYSFSDPVAYAASTHMTDGALAIMAKYSACKWEMGDGYTDYLQGVPAAAGQPIRAIADSGFGSSPGNAMEMLNWVNKDSSNMGTMALPVMRLTNGRKNSDHAAYDTWGFWCRKSDVTPVQQPNPRNRVPYETADAHFALAAVSVPGIGSSGVVFQASHSEAWQCSELGIVNGQPQARWVDSAGTAVELLSPTRLVANTPAILSFTSVPGAQRLRVNGALAGSGAATFAYGVPDRWTATAYDQMLLGWGFLSYYPRNLFSGNIYAVITGKGAPSAGELDVLERYLRTAAGV